MSSFSSVTVECLASKIEYTSRHRNPNFSNKQITELALRLTFEEFKLEMMLQKGYLLRK